MGKLRGRHPAMKTARWGSGHPSSEPFSRAVLSHTPLRRRPRGEHRVQPIFRPACPQSPH